MSPFTIILTELLMVSFVIIMIVAGKTNDNAHKCVYPTVPFCYMDWKCPSHKDDSAAHNVTGDRNQLINNLGDCTKLSKTKYNSPTNTNCGCKDPSYNYKPSPSQTKGYQTTRPTFTSEGALGKNASLLSPGDNTGVKVTLGTDKPYTQTTVANAPLFCQKNKGNVPTTVPAV